ncbi:cytidylate kinase-like family protein [Azospirillum formosense]|uniref:cytidylate kinase-like family protein n=1 Tax=Azospirillum formosense TaxID=861533 RepID=UPI00338F2984
MARDDFQALLTYVRTDQLQPHRPRSGPLESPPPVVTIAREHGTGGEAIAAKLAGSLGVPCFDKEILDAVVATATSDPALMRQLDEKLPGRAGMFLYASLMGLHDPLTEYQRLLTRVVNGIAFRGGVIVGRGAHLLRGAPRFRVRIVGSDEVCAARLAGGDPAKVADALHEVQRVNAARAKYFKEFFKISNGDPLQYDLIVNTDRFTDLDAVTDLILHAYRIHGGHAETHPPSPIHQDSTSGP